MRAKRELTPEQRAATEARRARFRALVVKLKEMDQESREAFVAKFGGVLKLSGGALSVPNAVLVLMQDDKATVVGGLKQWRQFGRKVRKGEHGLMIWCPTLNDRNDAPQTETEEVHYFPGTVFDITQTDEIRE